MMETPSTPVKDIQMSDKKTFGAYFREQGGYRHLVVGTPLIVVVFRSLALAGLVGIFLQVVRILAHWAQEEKIASMDIKIILFCGGVLLFSMMVLLVTSFLFSVNRVREIAVARAQQREQSLEELRIIADSKKCQRNEEHAQ